MWDTVCVPRYNKPILHRAGCRHVQDLPAMLRQPEPQTASMATKIGLQGGWLKICKTCKPELPAGWEDAY